MIFYPNWNCHFFLWQLCKSISQYWAIVRKFTTGPISFDSLNSWQLKLLTLNKKRRPIVPNPVSCSFRHSQKEICLQNRFLFRKSLKQLLLVKRLRYCQSWERIEVFALRLSGGLAGGNVDHGDAALLAQPFEALRTNCGKHQIKLTRCYGKLVV